MRWEDEPYVKFYVRDTPEFLAMSLQARCLLLELVRKVDRAGTLKVGTLGIEGIAIAVRAPLAEVEAPVRELLKEKRLEWNEEQGYFIIPNHIEAQTTPQSEVSRKRREREFVRAARSKTEAVDEASSAVTHSDEMSRGVTRSGSSGHAVPEGHALSSDVTCGHAETDDVTNGHDASRAATAGHAESESGQATNSSRANAERQRSEGVPKASNEAMTADSVEASRDAACEMSRAVTLGHVPSRDVTRGHEMSPLEENRRERREESRLTRARVPAGADARARASLTPIDPERVLSTEGRAYAESVGVTEVDCVHRDFVNFNVSEAKVSANWEAMWRRWCDRELRIQRRERDRARGSRGPMQQDKPGEPRGWEMPPIIHLRGGKPS